MQENDSGIKPKKDTPLQDLVLNWLIPILILKKGADVLPLSPEIVLLVALAFPIGFGLKDFFSAHKVNIFSILGFANVMLTGVIGLLELSPGWVAVKEAAIPGILGLAVLISMRTPYPLVKTVLYNPKILKVDLIDDRLERNQSREAFESTLNRATLYLSGSFFLSAALNYALARVMVKTSPAVDKDLFNSEISSMWAWSMVVIVVPSMAVLLFALWTIFRGIKRHTGLTVEEVMVGLDLEAKD